MLAVSVPKIRAEHPRAAEVRPRRVENWLSGLQGQEPHQTAHQIHQALFAQNRVALDEENRLQLLELFQPQVGETVHQLQQIYTSVPLPLSERQRTYFSHSFRLLQEIAYGYKIVASDIAAHGRAAIRQANLVLSMQRALFYIGKLLLNHYQCYEIYPKGSWREIHQLYKYAETNNLLTQPAATPTDPETAGQDGMMSIHDAYQQIMLTGAVHPYGFLSGECLRIYKMAARWHSLAHISKRLDHDEPAGRFLLSLISDHPPIPLAKATKHNNEENLRVLSVMDLVKEIHRGLQQLEADGHADSEFLIDTDLQQVHFLKRLGRALGAVKIRRRSTRTRIENDIDISIGINAIHYYASGEQQFKPPGMERGDAAANMEFQTPPPKISDEEFIDLNDPSLPARAREHPDDVASRIADNAPTSVWQQNGIYNLYRAVAKDESAGGLRLMILLPSELRLRVGDLVGMRYPNPDRWCVSAVRWMRNPQPEFMEVGLQLLAPELFPAAVRRHGGGGEQNQYFQALLLPGNIALQIPESILMPSGTYRLNEQLAIQKGAGDPEIVTASRVLEQSGSYDRLVVAADPTSGESVNQSGSSSDLS